MTFEHQQLFRASEPWARKLAYDGIPYHLW